MFPRTALYNPEWLHAAASGGANSLLLTEWLTQAIDLKPGMKVLDLGCGRAASSIFLHREFGVEVWAADLWFSAEENAQRIRDAGCTDAVHPIHADARSLPFEKNFFDVILAIDSYLYFGTDDLYLSYLARYAKPEGIIAIAGAGLTEEIEAEVPAHLKHWWTPDLWCLHSAQWWKRHWEKSGMVEIQQADNLPNAWQHWSAWHKAIAPDNTEEIDTLEADQGRYLTYIRVVARRGANAIPPEPIISIPASYTYKPVTLSRDGDVAS